MQDGKPWPKISIVTPSYNQGLFIEKTIRSVLLQGYPDLELIVIDGGSTDNSVEIIRKYEKWLTYWVSEPDRGQSHAINKGFARASGNVYGWLNSDDYLLASALENLAVARSKSPGAEAWCGGCERVDVRGRRIWVRWPKRLDADGLAKWSSNSIGQPALFFSDKAWQECGPLDENLHYGMDLDFFLTLAKAFPIAPVESILAAELSQPQAKTERDMGQMFAIQCLIQIRHGYELEAVEDITQWRNDYLLYRKRIDRLLRLPLARRFVAPLVIRTLESIHLI